MISDVTLPRRWIWPLNKPGHCACGCEQPIPADRTYFASAECVEYFKQHHEGKLDEIAREYFEKI